MTIERTITVPAERTWESVEAELRPAWATQVEMSDHDVCWFGYVPVGEDGKFGRLTIAGGAGVAAGSETVIEIDAIDVTYPDLDLSHFVGQSLREVARVLGIAVDDAERLVSPL